MKIKETLKPFDLEKAKQGAKLVTDRGFPARIICWDCKSEDYVLIALVLIDGKESPVMFMKDGTSYMADNFQSKLLIVEEVEIPDKWRDDEKAKIFGYYVTSGSKVEYAKGRNTSIDFNVFAEEKQALATIAAARISQIIANDERFGGAIKGEEWNNSSSKYCINRYENRIVIEVHSSAYSHIAFHTREQAELFLKENCDLIEQFYML